MPKPTNDASRPPRGNAGRPRGEKPKPASPPKGPGTRNDPDDSANEIEKPDWWRGDPGKRGEVT